MAERSAPNGETLHFFLSDLVEEAAAATFAEHERRIRERLPQVEVRHTGGTSVRGVLTMGDVDLQVRTDQESFGAARNALGELYEPHHPEVWHSEGAFFVAPGANPRVELALTVVGSLDDLHHGDAWRQIAADPDLIERYNAMKRAHEGGEVGDYDAAKRAFFYDNFRL
jgi:GrpB-like predicted nucleotidyltransferase (UPF0157 family)